MLHGEHRFNCRYEWIHDGVSYRMQGWNGIAYRDFVPSHLGHPNVQIRYHHGAPCALCGKTKSQRRRDMRNLEEENEDEFYGEVSWPFQYKTLAEFALPLVIAFMRDVRTVNYPLMLEQAVRDAFAFSGAQGPCVFPYLSRTKPSYFKTFAVCDRLYRSKIEACDIASDAELLKSTNISVEKCDIALVAESPQPKSENRSALAT